MSVRTKVVLVTGANKGMGREIVKELCWLFDGDVILSARNEQRGMETMKQLQEAGLKPKFLQLDVTSSESIAKARQHILENYGHLDVLVNNAGVSLNDKMGLSWVEQAVGNMQTNYFGVINVTRAFLPLMRPNGRVISIGSESANVLQSVSLELQMQFLSRELTFEKLTRLMEDYLESVKAGPDDMASKGWPLSDAVEYSCCIAEIGRILFAELLAKECSNDPNNDIDIVGIIPGWVKTDMGGAEAPDELPTGAAPSVFAACLPLGRSQYHGKFITRDKEVMTWEKIKHALVKYGLTKAQL